MTDIRLPPELLPSDGRFGSGPSKIRNEAVAALAAAAPTYLGTSHRREGVKSVVRRIQRQRVPGLHHAEPAGPGRVDLAVLEDVVVDGLGEELLERRVDGLARGLRAEAGSRC